MGLIGFLHAMADYLLSLVKMVSSNSNFLEPKSSPLTIIIPCHKVQNREVGWKTIDRKASRKLIGKKGRKETNTSQTGREMREQQPLLKKIKIFILFNPLTEWIDTTHMMRLHLHHKNVQSGTSN